MSPGEPAPLGAVLFDLDGTLVDSHPALLAAYREFVAAHGGVPSDAEYQRWNGPPLAAIVAGLQQAHRIEGELAALLEEYVRRLEGRYLGEATLALGAERLLGDLRRSGIACALVTSAPRRLAGAMLAARGIGQHFTVIVCGDEVEHGKPAPDGYLAALAQLGVSPRAVIAIEDTPSGVRAAVGAGLRCLGVGPASAQLLYDGAVAAITGLDEAREIIEALGRGPGRVIAATRIEARADHAPRHFDPATEAKVDASWAIARAERPSLSDGEIVTLHAVERDGDALHLRAGLTRYRYFLAQRRGLPLGLRALGVTAITLLHGEGGARLVLGRRSQQVTQYPGCWELVPSGGVARERVDADGVVDLRGQALEELAEELGVALTGVEAIAPLGLLEDLADRVVDVAFRIDLRAEPAALAAHVSASREYSELALPLARAVRQDRAELVRAVRGGELAPTVMPLLDLFERTRR